MVSFRTLAGPLRKALFCGSLVAALAGSHGARADTAIDTVLLKGGGRLRGTIMVDDPKTGVSIRLLDGTTRDVKRADVQEVDYAPTQAVAPTPPAPPPAAPSPATPSSSGHGLPPVALGAPPNGAAAAPATDPAPALRPTRHRRRAYDEGSGNDDLDGDNDGTIAPPGTHYESRSLKGLWVAGLVLDLSAWAIRAAITAAVCEADGPCSGRQVAGAAVPVVGAWVQLSAGIGDGDGQNKPAGVAAEVGFGIVETAGFIMFVSGLAVHKKHLVHDSNVDLGKVRIAPVFSGRSLGISGSF